MSNFSLIALVVCALLVFVSSSTTTIFAQHHIPSYTPPPPPTGTTLPPPAPTDKYFTQTWCYDSSCAFGCHNQTLPTEVCFAQQGPNGATTSARAFCRGNMLLTEEYPESSKCEGFSINGEFPLDQCIEDGTGQGYFTNKCDSTKPSSSVHDRQQQKKRSVPVVLRGLKKARELHHQEGKH